MFKDLGMAIDFYPRSYGFNSNRDLSSGQMRRPLYNISILNVGMILFDDNSMSKEY